MRFENNLLKVNRILEWWDRISYNEEYPPIKNFRIHPLGKIEELKKVPLVLKNGMEHFIVEYWYSSPIYGVMIGKNKYAKTTDFKNYYIGSTEVDVDYVKTLYDEYVEKVDEWFIITRAGAAKTTKNKVIIANENGVYEYGRNGETWEELHTLTLDEFKKVYEPKREIIDTLPGHKKSILTLEDGTIIEYDHETGRTTIKNFIGNNYDYVRIKHKIFLKNGTIDTKNMDKTVKRIMVWGRKLDEKLSFRMYRGIHEDYSGFICEKKVINPLVFNGRNYYYDYFEDVYVSPKTKLCFTYRHSESKFHNDYYCPVIGKYYPEKIRKKILKEKGIRIGDVLPGIKNIKYVYNRTIVTDGKHFEPRPEYSPEKDSFRILIPYAEGLYELEIPYNNKKDLYSLMSIEKVPEEYIAREVLYAGGFKDLIDVWYYEYYNSKVFIMNLVDGSIRFQLDKKMNKIERIRLEYKDKEYEYGKEILPMIQSAESLKKLITFLFL